MFLKRLASQPVPMIVTIAMTEAGRLISMVSALVNPNPLMTSDLQNCQRRLITMDFGPRLARTSLFRHLESACTLQSQ